MLALPVCDSGKANPRLIGKRDMAEDGGAEDEAEDRAVRVLRVDS
jgi:hypothetical protein